MLVKDIVNVFHRHREGNMAIFSVRLKHSHCNARHHAICDLHCVWVNINMILRYIHIVTVEMGPALIILNTPAMMSSNMMEYLPAAYFALNGSPATRG